MKQNSADTTTTTVETGRSVAIQGVRDFGLLVKFRLSLLVLYSALMSYGIVSEGNFSRTGLVILAIGGFMVTAAANILNQVLERDYDKLMTRTANRPLAAGRLSVSKAVMWAGLLSMSGISLLALFNPLASFLGMLSFISYAFVYTPLKRVTPVAVLVGALPGALPLMIGSAAFEGTISAMGWLLFSFQFLWQFPHFWAVAWLADEDYKRAGYYLLPSRSGEATSGVGLWSLAVSLLLFGLIFLGYWGDLISSPASVALQLLNGYYAWRCYNLYKFNDRKAARQQMFASFLHLPLGLLIILIDKL